MMKLGGLWKGTTKNGDLYLSGNLNYGTKFVVFKNSYKKKENEPDYILYLDEINRENDQSQEQEQQPEPF